MTEDNQQLSAKPSNPEILERTLENALRQIKRSASGLLPGGIGAGLNLSFGALFMGIVLAFSTGFGSPFI